MSLASRVLALTLMFSLCAHSGGYEQLIDDGTKLRQSTAYKGFLMGLVLGTTVLDISYGFWVSANNQLAHEVTTEPGSSDARVFFGLSLGGAISNGITTLIALPLLLTLHPRVGQYQLASALSTSRLPTVIIFGNIVVNAALQACAGVFLERVIEDTSQNPPQALTHGVSRPLWLANTMLTGLMFFTGLAVVVSHARAKNAPVPQIG